MTVMLLSGDPPPSCVLCYLTNIIFLTSAKSPAINLQKYIPLESLDDEASFNGL
jgi:hypothetical protein